MKDFDIRLRSKWSFTYTQWNKPNAKEAADFTSSDGDEKQSKMATASSWWLLKSLKGQKW